VAIEFNRVVHFRESQLRNQRQKNRTAIDTKSIAAPSNTDPTIICLNGDSLGFVTEFFATGKLLAQWSRLGRRFLRHSIETKTAACIEISENDR